MLTQPPPGDASSMGPLLQWTQPPQATWFQVQVIPFNEDGPGINLVIGDGALVSAAQYQVLGPNFGSADPNYVLLPDMTYLWRVRTSTVLTNPTEADWSAWAASSFRTPPASSSTITRVAPPFFREVRTLTPTLTWANSNAAVFYYEVQLSRDYEFGPNAFLYSEYVHGGASTPANSYVVPEAFPLEAGAFYYWRVRPRIQGDGDPLPWSRHLRVPGAIGIGRRQPVHWSHGVGKVGCGWMLRGKRTFSGRPPHTDLPSAALICFLLLCSVPQCTAYVSYNVAAHCWNAPTICSALHKLGLAMLVPRRKRSPSESV